MKRAAILALLVALASGGVLVSGAAPDKMIGVNVVLNTDITNDILKEIGRFGKVRDQIPAIDALTMQARESELAAIQALPFVASAGPDAEREGAPIDTVEADSFGDGLSTWNLDAINVTDFGFEDRQVEQDDAGVYVAVLDSGLVDSWRQYFPQERIATQYAISFGGGGGLQGEVSTQPNKWEHDQNSHGTHVTSTILGFSLNGTPVNGVAPMATVIPVKVLNQNGSGWSSVIARGIIYVAELKEGPLADHPVVINMSLGGSVLDAVEKAAIDYAISRGVIIVASAGNRGEAGMGYPGAYAPVISAAASGWIGEWYPGYTSTWWCALNVAESATPGFYITDFSSRAKTGQDLDVAAPGTWVVGPYQTNSGQTSYYFLGGTSMASPHVAGIVALMAQKKPALTAGEAEGILEESAIYLAPGTRNVYQSNGTMVPYTWGADATGAGLVNAAGALNKIP